MVKSPAVRRPRALKSLAVVALLLTGAWVTDNVYAIRAERQIAHDTQAHARLEVEPRVSIGGFPYLANYFRSETPTLSTDVMDIKVPGFGLVSAQTIVNDLQLPKDQVLSGKLDQVPAKLLTRRLRLDGVAMGEFMHITDLDISNPYDISPSGGPASEVQFTGTPQGFDKPVTVLATLRIDDTTISITPREVLDGPADRTQEIKEAFAWSIDSRLLPMPTRTNRVYCSGGSIYFESEQRSIVIDASNLSPISTPSEYAHTGAKQN